MRTKYIVICLSNESISRNNLPLSSCRRFYHYFHFIFSLPSPPTPTLAGALCRRLYRRRFIKTFIRYVKYHNGIWWVFCLFSSGFYLDTAKIKFSLRKRVIFLWVMTTHDESIFWDQGGITYTIRKVWSTVSPYIFSIGLMYCLININTYNFSRR